MSAAIDWIGWTGGGLVLVAYGLISWERVSSRSTGYHWLNAAGSALLIANTVYYGAFPSAFVNVVWLVLAAISLIKLRRPPGA